MLNIVNQVPPPLLVSNPPFLRILISMRW